MWGLSGLGGLSSNPPFWIGIARESSPPPSRAIPIQNRRPLRRPFDVLRLHQYMELAFLENKDGQERRVLLRPVTGRHLCACEPDGWVVQAARPPRRPRRHRLAGLSFRSLSESTLDDSLGCASRDSVLRLHRYHISTETTFVFSSLRECSGFSLAEGGPWLPSP